MSSSYEDQPGSPYYQFETSAREIASAAINRYGSPVIGKMPPALVEELTEIITSAVHDGIEFGEAIAALPDEEGPTKLEHYFQGYRHAIEDLEQQGGMNANGNE